MFSNLCWLLAGVRRGPVLRQLGQGPGKDDFNSQRCRVRMDVMNVSVHVVVVRIGVMDVSVHMHMHMCVPIRTLRPKPYTLYPIP